MSYFFREETQYQLPSVKIYYLYMCVYLNVTSPFLPTYLAYQPTTPLLLKLF